MACTSEGEANQLHDIEAKTEAAEVAQSPPTRLLQVPPQCRLHDELLAGARRSTTVLTLHSVGHTCKDHSRRLQPPVLSPFRTTLVCITFGALQVDKMREVLP